MTTNHQHIVKSYDDEIKDLNSRISHMGNYCQKQLHDAIESLQTSDLSLAKQVVANDETLNSLHREFEETAVITLAKRNPVAVDLRYFLAAMRVGMTLERIGDYAGNIAKRVLELTDQPESDAVKIIQDIADICSNMLSDVIGAFVELNTEKAVEVWHKDDVVDRKFARMMTLVRLDMEHSAGDIKNNTQLIFIGRCLERVGDHITNIAEDIMYIESGEAYIAKFEN